MWIGKDATGSFQEQFEVQCELNKAIEDDVMT
jgi:hypothetical protein